MSENWDERFSQRIGKEIHRLRRAGGLNGQQLSDRTHELGHRVSRSTISDIETNRRKTITVTDTVSIAAALNVPPIALLYGPDWGDDVEVLPGLHDRGIDAAQWFSGLRDHGYTDSPDGAESARLRAEFRRNIRELVMWRELFDVQQKIGTVVASPTRVVNGELVADPLTAVQLAQLENWQDRERSLRAQLGIGSSDLFGRDGVNPFGNEDGG